jgi:hypothetical protein
MSAGPQNESIGKVVVAVPGEELRRQLIDFLAGHGYDCVGMPTLEAGLEIAGEFCTGLDLVIGDGRLSEAQRAAAERLSVRMLFLCSEPECIATEIVSHPYLAFIEKPFAWSELNRKLSELPAAPRVATAAACADAA